MRKYVFASTIFVAIVLAVPASAQVGLSIGHRGVQLHLNDHRGHGGSSFDRGHRDRDFDRGHHRDRDFDRPRRRDRDFDRPRGRDHRSGRGGSWHFVPH